MRDIRGREELLHHPSNGIGVGAHAPLFHHHIALFVELARNRMAETAALHIRPQLQPVRRHAPEVLRRIKTGGCVDARRAVLLGNLSELVRNDVLLRVLLRRVECLAQLLQLRRVLSHPLAVLAVVGGVGVFHLLERDLLRRPIRGANLVGAFEGEVLEHVRETGLPGRVIRVACVHQRVVGEDRRLRPLDEQHGQPIGKDLCCDPLLKVGKLLLRQVRCRFRLNRAGSDQGQAAGKCRQSMKLQTSFASSAVGQGNAWATEPPHHECRWRFALLKLSSKLSAPAGEVKPGQRTSGTPHATFMALPCSGLA